MALFSKEAIERRLGIPDSRGPQGMFSRGSNVYRGGLPNAQSGSGNPNIGRPAKAQASTRPMATGMTTPSVSMTTLVGSLPPGAGNQDGDMNAAIMNLLQNNMRRRLNG